MSIWKCPEINNWTSIIHDVWASSAQEGVAILRSVTYLRIEEVNLGIILKLRERFIRFNNKNKLRYTRVKVKGHIYGLKKVLSLWMVVLV